MSTTPAASPLPGTLLPCYVFDSHQELARHVAQLIAGVIRDRAALGQRAVLGLPTGSTPVGIYRELGRLHQCEGLDFSNVITFNLDEYLGLGPDRLQSYRRWMQEHLFKFVNIPPENIHIPDGLTPSERLDEYCREYEAAIAAAGGIDLQLLGIGRNGHIGFNEPFRRRNARTRVATLDPVTRRDAASDFFSEENVPTQAITMGLGTIFDARKIVLIALGEHKADIIRETAEGPGTPRVPACYLRDHPDATLLVDSAAAGKLTAVATPWLLGKIDWTDALVKRALLWLSQQTGKALLKLDDDDFRQHNLHTLLRHHGPAQSMAHRVFRWMMETIEYHPAGRDSQRVICFSPHPDDDVISMGGTMIRLVEDKHEVHVAYMTSGNIAVFDHDARQIADLVAEFNRLFGIDQCKSHELLARGRVAGQQGAGRKRHARGAGDQVADPLERGQGRGHRGRLPRGAFALSRFAFLPHRHDRQEAAQRGRHWHRPRADRTGAAGADLRGRRPVGSARHAPGVRRGDLPRRRPVAGRPARSAALSWGVAGMGTARDRDRGAVEPARFAIEAGRHLPARVAERRGPVPRSRHRASSGARRRPQSPHRRRVQPARPA